MFVVLAEEEVVGHAGDVIADDDVARFGLREFFIGEGHRAGLVQKVGKEIFKTFYRAVAVFGDGRMILDMGEEKAFEGGIGGVKGSAELSEPL